MIKREYSWSVDGIPATTRESAREMQRRMRREGEPKASTKILQRVVSKSERYVR